MKIKYLSFILLFMSSVGASAAAAQADLDSAANAYSRGEYSSAAMIYEKVAKEDGVSSHLLANMGNAYVKAGDYGRGRLCYERSLLLNPSDSEVRNNLDYIISKIEDNNKGEAHGKKVSVSPDSPSFFSSVKKAVAVDHTSDAWAIWAAVSFIIFCGCVALYLFMSDVMIRKIGFFGGIAMLAVSVITLAFSFMAASVRNNRNSGVLVGYKVTLLTEPFATAKASAAPLTRGTLLDVLDTESDADGNVEWFKVRLNSDYVGWVPAADFEVI